MRCQPLCFREAPWLKHQSLCLAGSHGDRQRCSARPPIAGPLGPWTACQSKKLDFAKTKLQKTFVTTKENKKKVASPPACTYSKTLEVFDFPRKEGAVNEHMEKSEGG